MLSDRERRVLDELERTYYAEATKLPRSGPGGRRRQDGHRWHAFLPGVAAGGISVLLLIAGAPTSALAIAAATGLGWLLWHFWPALSTANRAAGPCSVDADHSRGQAHHRRDRKRRYHADRITEAK